MPPQTNATTAPAKTILAVDDEPGISGLIKFILEHHGYQVETAGDGAEALTLLLQKRYDLLITDVMMPKIDGFELVAHVRQDPEQKSLPVIMLTARATDADINTGYTTGADLYLTKPFSPDELAMLVQRVLSQV